MSPSFLGATQHVSQVVFFEMLMAFFLPRNKTNLNRVPPRLYFLRFPELCSLPILLTPLPSTLPFLSKIAQLISPLLALCRELHLSMHVSQI